MTEQAWTFIEVLNNPDTREEVDAIEDLLSSLKGREDDPTLNEMLTYKIAELKAKTGFTYQA